MIRGPFLVLCTIATIYGQTNSNDPDRDRAIADIFTTPDGDFFKQFEDVTTPKGTGFGATEKCGEGSDKNVHMCVPYYNCDSETRTLISSAEYDGTGLIDIRFGTNNCDDYLDVCCGLTPGASIPPELTTPPTGSVTPEPVSPPTPPPVNPDTPVYCGIRNPNGVDFKITGNSNHEAEFGEFPWMVAVIKKNFVASTSDKLANCGGSLIAPNVVLTAAHCVNSNTPPQLKIRAGEWDTQTVGERYPYQERDVQRIIVHPGFTSNNLFNDIAIIILIEPFDRAPHIGSICLPTQGQLFNSRECYATGWGKDLFGQGGKYQAILKKIQLPTVEHDRCQTQLRQTRLGPKFKLHNSFVCAGGETGKDTCTGDGGGPLACPDPSNPSRYVLTGIVSWGIGCAQVNTPGVYAGVAGFTQWVDSELAKLRIDSGSYRN